MLRSVLGVSGALGSDLLLDLLSAFAGAGSLRFAGSLLTDSLVGVAEIGRAHV